MKPLATLLLLLATIPALASKVPDSAWQDGTLREMTTDSHTRLFGASNDGHGVIGTAAYVVTHYIIDGPNGYSYEVNRLIRGRQKQLLVTVHGPIKFALVGHDFYIRDDEGKTQKLIFVERVLRTTQP